MHPEASVFHSIHWLPWNGVVQKWEVVGHIFLTNASLYTASLMEHEVPATFRKGYFV